MLENLRPPRGATHKKKRLGRGQGTHGKTSGKGHKGQGQKGNLPRPYFEGGQTPFIRRVPKRGFRPPFRENIQEINIQELVKHFKEGDTVTPEKLIEAGIMKKNIKFKILGKGNINYPLHIKNALISQGAKEKIEKAGGSVSS